MKSLVGDLAKPGSCDYVLGGSEFGIPDEKAWRQESGCRKHNERNGKDRGGVVVSCALLGLIPSRYLIPGTYTRHLIPGLNTRYSYQVILGRDRIGKAGNRVIVYLFAI